MAETFIFVFLFFLPAGIANMVPVFAARVPGLRNWEWPMDGGRSWRGRRLLGDHKTWRGFAAGTASAVLAAVIISKVDPFFYQGASPVLIGFLLGAGALAGDAVKSFFKRRAGIPSGKAWFPFDQVDYIAGAIAFSFWYAPLRPAGYLLMLALGFVLHLLIVYIGYLTKLRDQAI